MIVAQLLLGPVPAASPEPGQQFGLQVGAPLSALTVIERGGEHVYHVRVPRPSADYAVYIATVTPADGLCRVQALTPALADDSFGTQARAKFHSLRTGLAARYGQNRLFEFVEQSASSVKPGDWAETIRRGERSLAAFWDADEQSSLPPEIGNVRLQVGATSWRSTYVSMVIEFANFPSCARRLYAGQDRAPDKAPGEPARSPGDGADR